MRSKVKLMLTLFFDSYGGALRICFTRPNHYQRILSVSFRSHSWCCAGKWPAKTWKHPPIIRDWFRLSWPNITFLRFVRLSILPSRLPLVFGSSSSWKCCWKGLSLNHNKTSFVTQWLNSTVFPKKPSRNASNVAGLVEEVWAVPRGRLHWRMFAVSDLLVSNNCIFPSQESKILLE